MTDRDLDELMERLGDRTPVGPPPLGAIFDGARCSSRRRLAVVGVAAAAVLAVVGGTALTVGLGGSGDGPGKSDDVVAPDERFTPPPGTRLVGIGHVAVAVPETWPLNKARCGTPVTDTVILEIGTARSCLVTHAPASDVVDLSRGMAQEFDASRAESVDVDGRSVLRSPLQCVTSPHAERAVPQSGNPELCSTRMYFPDADVTVWLSSSRAQAHERVREMLTWVGWLDDRVAVPSWLFFANQHQEKSGQAIRGALSELGLGVQMLTVSRPGMPAGFLLGTDPEAGTMLEPGSVVAVTVVAEPSGPAEEVSVWVNSQGTGPERDYVGLDDTQIRSGRGRLTVPVGGLVWFGETESRGFEGRLIGEFRNDAGDPESGVGFEAAPGKDSPTWLATHAGVVRLTISLERDGERYEIGTVTIVVE